MVTVQHSTALTTAQHSTAQHSVTHLCLELVKQWMHQLPGRRLKFGQLVIQAKHHSTSKGTNCTAGKSGTSNAAASQVNAEAAMQLSCVHSFQQQLTRVPKHATVYDTAPSMLRVHYKPGPSTEQHHLLTVRVC
jgi:hypothetical protein